MPKDAFFRAPLWNEFYELWHHEGRRARMGSAMMAPDYAWWHGFYECKKRFVVFMSQADQLLAPQQEGHGLQGLSRGHRRPHPSGRRVRTQEEVAGVLPSPAFIPLLVASSRTGQPQGRRAAAARPDHEQAAPGGCTVDPGLIMVDMLYQLEKIGDCCFNIAQALLRRDYDASAWVA